MKKEEYIKRYGKEAYEKMHQQSQDWKKKNPEKAKAESREASHKGGKYYEQHRRHQMEGITHEKELVRGKHVKHYHPYKKIIAPDSELHHSWKNDGTAGYIGVALVEKDQHRHGYIDVIQILEGEITLFTEAEIRGM